MRTTSILSHLLLPLLLLTGLVRPAGEELEAALGRFRTATSSEKSDARTSALAELVALADAAAMPALRDEYGRTALKVREARDASFKAKYALDRIEGLIATMELRLERDASLKESVTNQKNKRNQLRTDYERAEKDLAKWTPWRDELAAGVVELLDGLAKGKRKKAEDEIWEVAREAEKPLDRLAAVELLGHVGSEGTALELQKLYFELVESRGRAKKEMRKAEADVRKMEARLQEEAARNDGATSRASAEQYDRIKKESSELRKRVTLEGHVADAAVEAGGRALARETDKALDKSLTSLLRALKKTKDGGYVGLIEMLGGARVEPVRARLRALLAEEREPLGRAKLIEALAAAGDTSLVDDLIAKYLADEEWLVRSSAAHALAELRDVRAIPALIDRLDVEDVGRLRTDDAHALSSLTGKDFNTNVTLWRRWWNDVKDGFQVPEAGGEIEASTEAQESVGVTFFGIKTESQRVLFVLDLSGSMNFSMVPRRNPDDDIRGGREPDLPQDGEQSRLQAAKQDLQKAMGGLREGALFNVVFYASDVWTWQDQLVEMTPDTRTEITETVNALEAVGGTNIYGALQTAFDMAGAEEGAEWSRPKVDTIFLLSDGKPSVGVSVDADEILAMVREKNASAGIVVHTIGLSGAQDAYLLRTLAEENGGDYAAR